MTSVMIHYSISTLGAALPDEDDEPDDEDEEPDDEPDDVEPEDVEPEDVEPDDVEPDDEDVDDELCEDDVCDDAEEPNDALDELADEELLAAGAAVAAGACGLQKLPLNLSVEINSPFAYTYLVELTIVFPFECDVECESLTSRFGSHDVPTIDTVIFPPLVVATIFMG